MKTSVQRIDRVTADFEPHDTYVQVPNPYHPAFYIVPTQVVVEFDHDEPDPDRAVLRATVTGQRWRMLLDGPKPVGAKLRGPAWTPTTWEFPSRRSMPHELATLVDKIRRSVPGDA